MRFAAAHLNRTIIWKHFKCGRNQSLLKLTISRTRWLQFGLPLYGKSFVAIPDVKWDDIGGLTRIKHDLQVLIVRSLKRPGELEDAGITPPRGVLLHGPSGTGKTMIAKAIAHEAGVNFIAVDGPEIFGKWLGSSEAAIRHIFRVARQLSPCIVFFDQLDALAPRRGMESGSRTTERVVNQILSELDGIKALSNILVIGATNRVDLVDSSVLRPGRLGTRIFVPLPNWKIVLIFCIFT